MAERSIPGQPMLWALAYLSISWLVFLSGTAASRDQCNIVRCTETYALVFWEVFYQLIWLVLLSYVAYTGQLTQHRMSLLVVLAPLLALLMSTSNVFVYNSSSADQALAAGAIMLSIGNLALMYILGLEGGVAFLTSELETDQPISDNPPSFPASRNPVYQQDPFQQQQRNSQVQMSQGSRKPIPASQRV